MSVELKGIITKSIGGIYTVDVSDNICNHKYITCKARGVFRKIDISPVCADRVIVEADGDTGVITKSYIFALPFGRPAAAACRTKIIFS